MDSSPLGSSVLMILQVRVLEWIAIPSSRESSRSRDGTQVSCISCIAGRLFTAEPPGKPFSRNKKLIWNVKQSSFFWDETIIVIKRCNHTSYSELLKLLGMFNLKRKTHGWGLLFVDTEAKCDQWVRRFGSWCEWSLFNIIICCLCATGLLLLLVQLLSHVWLFVTPWTAARQASLSFTIPQSLLKLVSIESVMLSHHLILCHSPLLLPSIFPHTRVFSTELAFHIRWPKYGASASASVLPMNIQGWFPLGWTGWISLQSKGLSRVFSSTTVQKHQFFSIQPSLGSSSHIHTWLLGKP